MAISEEWAGGALPLGTYPVRIVSHNYRESAGNGTTWLSFGVESESGDSGKVDFAMTIKAFWRFIAFSKACNITEEEADKIEVRPWKPDYSPSAANAYHGKWFMAYVTLSEPNHEGKQYANVNNFGRVADDWKPKERVQRVTAEPAEAPARRLGDDSLPF